MAINPMSSSGRFYYGAAAVILATVVGIAVAYPRLPEMVPTHWNAQGHVDGWSSKASLFLFGPGLMTGIVLMFAVLPWLSPKKFEVDSFRDTYLYIMIAVVGMMAYIQILILMAGLGVVLDISRAVVGGVSLLIALLGNVMGKVRRNFYVGIRTPWTIASERVWNATHRLAAKTMFVGGIAALLNTVFGGPFWISIALVMLGAFIPAGYSLFYYKKLEKQGELSA